MITPALNNKHRHLSCNRSISGDKNRMGYFRLKIPDRVAFANADIPADIDHKSDNQVDENRRAKAKKSNVYKEHTDFRSSYPHPLANER